MDLRLKLIFLGMAFGVPFALAQGISLPRGMGPVQTSPEDHSPSLTDAEKASLKFHLTHLHNEVDLLIQNHRADVLDVHRQEKEFQIFGMFERIPLDRKLRDLEKQVLQSAEEAHLQRPHFVLRRFSQPKSLLPKKLVTSSGSFRFPEDQLAEQIYFQIEVGGTEDQIQNWIRSWPFQVKRLIEADLPAGSKSPARLGKNRWRVSGHAFSFRKVRYPQLSPQNPRDLLPVWAKENPKAFSKIEPALWQTIEKTEALIPRALPFYKTREEFLLNDARFNFYLSKTSRDTD